MLTQERLKELLHYDPETGVWTWAVRRGNTANAGTVAGRIDGSYSDGGGYRRIKIDYHNYISSRLAHLYMTGEWPITLMDHVNGVRDDDRWSNLRNATHSENNCNKRVRKSQTGVRGVFKTRGGKYKVEFWLNRKSQYFGTYPTIEEAAAVAAIAEVGLYGEFAFSNRAAAAEPEFMEAA